ncbi:MAG: uracil-DNA glycosylase [Notoacmeibacter sp.]
MAAEPSHDCALCPRLNGFIKDWRTKEPDWFNGPVPVFSDFSPRLLIVGLAPGLRGANRTGRPFTGDFAGDLLYKMLLKYGFATGDYKAHANDGVTLVNTAIINAVRCVPPQNKPTPEEIKTCRPFLTPALVNNPSLKVVLTLGQIAHHSTIKALGQSISAHPFKHNADCKMGDLTIVSSYHCSRYNTNTGVLTEPMFDDVFQKVSSLVG